MVVAEKIYERVQKLPEVLQAEVLDFVEYLLLKARLQETMDETVWPKLSVALAMRGMEDEDSPEYTIGDLKETFLRLTRRD